MVFETGGYIAGIGEILVYMAVPGNASIKVSKSGLQNAQNAIILKNSNSFEKIKLISCLKRCHTTVIRCSRCSQSRGVLGKKVQ